MFRGSDHSLSGLLERLHDARHTIKEGRRRESVNQVAPLFEPLVSQARRRDKG